MSPESCGNQARRDETPQQGMKRDQRPTLPLTLAVGRFLCCVRALAIGWATSYPVLYILLALLGVDVVFWFFRTSAEVGSQPCAQSSRREDDAAQQQFAGSRR